MDNAQALAAYISTIRETHSTVLKILNHIDNHLGLNPEEVTWAHVGDVKHIETLAREILNFIERKED